MTKQLAVEVPEGLLTLLHEEAGQLGRDMYETAVVKWFEEGRLSQGQAATTLGLSRGEFFDLLYAHQVSPIQITTDDLREELQRG